MGVVFKVHQRLHLARTLWLLLLGLALVVWPGGAARAALPSRLSPGSYASAELTAPSITVRISPATTAVLLGAEFGVDVVIVAGGEQVNAADVHLQFDPLYLAITRDPVAGLFLTSVPKYTYDNVAGTLSFGAYRANGAASGTFTLCTVYFRSLNPTPSTYITYAQDPLVVSPASVVYAVTARNGTVVVTAPTATPTTTLTPSLTPTATRTPVPTETATPTATPFAADATALIRPDTGGNLKSHDLRVGVQVPPGAVTQNITLTLSYINYGAPLSEVVWDRCLMAAGPVFWLRGTTSDGSPLLSWAQPVTLTACFGPGGDVGNLALYRWNEGLGRWVKESTAWDETGYCVQTQTAHLGLFVVALPDGCLWLPIIVSS